MASDTNQKNADKFLDLLLYLSEQDEPSTVVQLANQMGVTRNTIYHMLSALQNRSFVEKLPDGRFVLGYGVLGLVSKYYQQYPFLYIAEKEMQELARQIGQPVSIFVYKSPLNCLRLYNTESSITSPKGVTIHACTTAAGKLLLAAQPDEVIQADLAAEPIEAYTSATITDPQAILAQAPDYRNAEYAVEFGERFPHNGTAAVPIRNHAGRTIAALCLFLTDELPDEQLKLLISKLQLSGRKISEALGNSSAALF